MTATLHPDRSHTVIDARPDDLDPQGCEWLTWAFVRNIVVRT